MAKWIISNDMVFFDCHGNPYQNKLDKKIKTKVLEYLILDDKEEKIARAMKGQEHKLEPYIEKVEAEKPQVQEVKNVPEVVKQNVDKQASAGNARKV